MDKWIGILLRWAAGAMLLIVLVTLGVDPNIVVWLIVYAGAFFACWGIGNCIVALSDMAFERWGKIHD